MDQSPYSLKSISHPLLGHPVEMIMPSRSQTYRASAEASKISDFPYLLSPIPEKHLFDSFSFIYRIPLEDFTIPTFLLSAVLQNLL